MTPSVVKLEAAIRAGVVAALRGRAALQAAIARADVVTTEGGVASRTGEAANVIANRIAKALAAIADEIERWTS
jgi:hypothetical protein